MLSLLLKTGKVGEQIQVTTDTMIKGDSAEFGARSLALSIVLMYLNPNPNPNPSPNREGWGTDTSDDRYNDKKGILRN